MEISSSKQSYKNMFQLIKKSNGAFFKAFILVLIPLLIISCYSFYTIYGGSGIDFSKIANADFTNVLEDNGDITEAIYSAVPQSNYKPTAADNFLDILSSVLIYVLDAYVILLATGLIFEKNNPDSSVLKASIKKIIIMIIVSLLASWVVMQVQSMVASTVYVVLMALNIQNRIFIMSSVIVSLIFLFLAVLLASWLLLYIRHMTIATVSGRCRFLISLSYAREILKGRVWKSMFRIMPFIIGGLIVPFMMQAFAVAFANNITLLIALVAVSTVLQLTVFMLMWIYTVPEFFECEIKSGIQQKIRDMIEKAMNMRKNQQNEDTNDNEKKEDTGDNIKE